LPSVVPYAVRWQALESIVHMLSGAALPEPVPPEISTFTRQRPITLRISAPSGETERTTWSALTGAIK
jgi:hypothetical protein